MDLNIGVLGGELAERKEIYKDIYKTLVDKSIFDDFEIEDNKKIIKKSFIYKNTNVNVFFENKDIFSSLELKNKNDEEILEEIHNYISENYAVQFHFIIAIYFKKGEKLLKELRQFSKENLMLFSFGIISFNEFQKIFDNKDRLYISLIDEETINFFKKEINEIITSYFPLYIQFTKYSVEHYYSFCEYKEKYINYSLINEIGRLIEKFNQFEFFSFDNEDYSDDSIIIIQILSNRKKKENLVVNLRRASCDKCKKPETISEYDKDSKTFLCQICLKKSKKENCQNCGVMLSRNTFIFMEDCCNSNFCFKCCDKEFMTKHNKGEKITCFCGKEVNDFILLSCLTEPNYRKIKQSN